MVEEFHLINTSLKEESHQRETIHEFASFANWVGLGGVFVGCVCGVFHTGRFAIFGANFNQVTPICPTESSLQINSISFTIVSAIETFCKMVATLYQKCFFKTRFFFSVQFRPYYLVQILPACGSHTLRIK